MGFSHLLRIPHPSSFNLLPSFFFLLVPSSVGKQSQLLLKPTEVELGLQVGVEFDNTTTNQKEAQQHQQTGENNERNKLRKPRRRLRNTCKQKHNNNNRRKMNNNETTNQLRRNKN